jgi:NAD(P)-dependent dehydrogenase (short-subunit alcohol dehydrogenase family)
MNTARFDLTGKTAVVTGGAGILGARFCGALAEHGANVTIVDLNKEAAMETRKKLITNGLPKEQLYALDCDVSDPASVAAMVDATVERFCSIDVLLNNAASKSNDLEAFFAPFETFSLEEWRKIMSVNIDGMFLVAQAVGRQMLVQDRGGSIIQTASIYGVVAPDPRIYEGSHYLGRQINTPAVYSASKAAVIGLSLYLAAYWGEQGIRVNTLSPGGVESGQNEIFQQRYGARVPLGRMARGDEMLGAIVFLASDASSYFTGQNVVVDGGLSCW